MGRGLELGVAVRIVVAGDDRGNRGAAEKREKKVDDLESVVVKRFWPLGSSSSYRVRRLFFDLLRAIR